MKCLVLGYQTAMNSDGKKVATQPPAEAADPIVTFRPNDFPYLVDPSIEHHCLWCSRVLCSEEIEEYLRHFRCGCEVIRCAIFLLI